MGLEGRRACKCSGSFAGACLGPEALSEALVVADSCICLGDLGSREGGPVPVVHLALVPEGHLALGAVLGAGLALAAGDLCCASALVGPRASGEGRGSWEGRFALALVDRRASGGRPFDVNPASEAVPAGQEAARVDLAAGRGGNQAGAHFGPVEAAHVGLAEGLFCQAEGLSYQVAVLFYQVAVLFYQVAVLFYQAEALCGLVVRGSVVEGVRVGPCPLAVARGGRNLWAGIDPCPVRHNRARDSLSAEGATAADRPEAGCPGSLAPARCV